MLKMNYCLQTILLFISFLVFQSCKTQKGDWFIKATYHEACSCNAPCPCPYGLPMTNAYCKLNSFIDIHQSKYKNTDLTGLKVILTGAVGKPGQFYIAEPVKEEQINAFKELISIVNPGGFKEISFGGKVPMTYKNENGEIHYSTQNIKVRLKPVIGNNNKPVIVNNLRGKLFENYTPHLAIVNSRIFTDTLNNFHYEKKAGFTSVWNISEINH
jgi:hypothetical protein